MSEQLPKERTQLEEAKANLKKILEEKNVTYRFDLRSSARTLADFYAFVIHASENGINPDEYYKVVSGVSTARVSIQFGEHPEDVLVNNYVHDMHGQLQKQEHTVSLWRKKGLPDYISEDN